jgi:hypothetical protein
LQIKQRKLRPELKAKRIPPCPVPHPSRQRSDFDRNCLLLRVLALRTLRNAVGVIWASSSNSSLISNTQLRQPYLTPAERKVCSISLKGGKERSIAEPSLFPDIQEDGSNRFPHLSGHSI